MAFWAYAWPDDAPMPELKVSNSSISRFDKIQPIMYSVIKFNRNVFMTTALTYLPARNPAPENWIGQAVVAILLLSQQPFSNQLL